MWRSMRAILVYGTIFLLPFLPPRSAAQTSNSRLIEIGRSGQLNVCVYPLYFAISFRNPQTGKLEGVDADMARELAKELGVELKFVESGFSTFIADLQANKCDIGMFGLGVTLRRAQAVEFSRPYLLTGLYAITRKDGNVRSWEDMDRPGVTVATTLGSFVETFLRGHLKQAKLVVVAPPSTSQAELMSRRADVIVADLPNALRMVDEFDWATYHTPREPVAVTPYAYAIPQGDQIWLNYVNQFLEVVKRDGRLTASARRFRLDDVIAR